MTHRPTIALLACAAFALFAACARSSSPPGFEIPEPPEDAAAPPPDDDASWISDGSPTLDFGDVEAGHPTQFPTHPTPPPHGTVSAGNVPPNAAGLFDGATVDPAIAAPALVYPTPETMFPPNMPDVLFQWRAPAGNLFRIHFAEGNDTLDVYTDGRTPTCDQAATGGQCWESAATDLMLYFGHASDIGADVTFSIAAMNTAQPTKMSVSPTYTVHVARTDITGAVYYWSTTAKGIRRGNFGGPAPTDGGVAKRPTPIDYITNKAYPPTTEAPDARCAACHTLSRDGTKLAVSLNGDVLGIVDVVATIPPPMTFGPPSKGFSGAYIGSSWSSFNPDNTRIVTATTGAMTVRSVATGQPIADAGTIALPDKVAGSMPDWAPDGQHLVFAATPISPPNASYGRHLYGSSIAMMTAQGDGFTGYDVIAASTETKCPPTLPGGVHNPSYMAGARETFANPMFSNDNKWVVFSRGECESENDPTAEVLLAPATPNAPRNRLVRANRQVGDKQVENVTNGMPVWGPTNDPHIAWIAFTSTRDYGLVLTAGSKTGSDKVPPFPGASVRQLWIAAVDLSKLTPGNTATLDPSYPAFRFSAQDLAENNHRPFWTVDVIPEVNDPPPPK
jgi:hypothetical protein